MNFLTNLFKKKTPDEKVSSFLKKLEKDSEKWTHVKWGRYLHKPILSRIIHHIVGIAEDEATKLVSQNQVLVNDERVNNAALRLGAGNYKLYIQGRGYYEFFIQ